MLYYCFLHDISRHTTGIQCFITSPKEVTFYMRLTAYKEKYYIASNSIHQAGAITKHGPLSLRTYMYKDVCLPFVVYGILWKQASNQRRVSALSRSTFYGNRLENHDKGWLYICHEIHQNRFLFHDEHIFHWLANIKHLLTLAKRRG